MRRGGGSRSSSRGGSRSRGFRTDRRHNRRYRRGYGYRGGYYYGYNTGGVIIAIVVFLFIFLLVGVLISTAVLSTPNNYNVNLGPDGTRLFQPSQFWRNGVEVQDTSGVIQTHFFDSRPPLLLDPVNRIVNDQTIVNGQNFEYWGFFLIKGSIIDITWSSNAELEFWIVVGNSDFNTWKDGDDVGTSFLPSTGFSSNVEATKSTDYYFIFNNLAFSTIATVLVSFDVKAKTYDLSNSKRSLSGSFSESDIDEKYVVLYNPSTILEITFQYLENPRFSFGTIFLVELAIIIGVVLLIKRYRKSRKSKTVRSPRSSVQYVQTAPSQFGTNSSQSKQNPYNQRPQAKFCPACGSAVLPYSTFCTECGTKV